MRILYLNPSGQFGGAETSLLHLMASLREAEPQWHLQLLTPADGPLPAEARRLGIAIATLPMPAGLARVGDSGARGRAALAGQLLPAMPAILRYTAALRQAIREAAPDVIHTNGFKMHILGIRARPAGIPVVWHLHDYVSARPAMKFLMRLHARDCTAAIANSRSVAADFAKATGRTARTLYNAIDIERFSPPHPDVPHDPPRIGMVATFARWKGHDVFLRALSLLPRDLRYEASIVGGPIYQTGGSQYSLEELRQLAVDLGVADRVIFTGFVEDAAAAMREFDIVVHCSVQPEPFG
ncbi:MAG: glycosyltransferase, partial [Bryobacteraceae bacterium]